MSWDYIYEKLVNYIKFASKQTSEQYSARADNSPEDLFQEGQIILYKCWVKYGTKDEEEFSRIFKTSLWRELRNICNKKQISQVDLDAVYNVGYEPSFVEELDTNAKLREVAEELSDNPIALTILKEFINPSTRTMWEAQADFNRKNCLQAQELVKYQAKEVIIRKKHIQRALEIPTSKFESAFREVKNTINLVFKVDDQFVEEYFRKIG